MYKVRLATEHACVWSLLIDNAGKKMQFGFDLKCIQDCDLLKT